jgi:hypothetical protein
MKNVPALCRRLVLAGLALCPAIGVACDSLPAGQMLWVRLNAPVTTYTAKVGDSVSAVLTEAVVCDNDVVLPIGTNVSGVVRSVRKVGWGIWHETAALDVQFVRVIPSEDTSLAITAEVMEVENAREQVSKGMIQGIRSSDSPQGRINSRLRHLPTYNPYSDLGLIIFKASFPIFPEPEIYLPAGTDMRLKLTKAMTSVPPSLMHGGSQLRCGEQCQLAAPPHNHDNRCAGRRREPGLCWVAGASGKRFP